MKDDAARGPRIRRRTFLLAGVAGAAGITGIVLVLRRLQPGTPPRPAPEAVAPPAFGPRVAAPAPPDYRGWEDVYREQWRWDRVVRGTHSNANCLAACAWNVYVRDGIVWREEQSAPYAGSNTHLPDWNPRGCQKGGSFSRLMYGPGRLRYPLRRIGPRGAGRWRRIGWDEALDEIARELVDVLVRRGGEGAVCELGTNLDFGPGMASVLRFFRQMGVPIADNVAQVGDVPAGGTITLATPWTSGSSDDWFRSDYLVLWAFNPSVSRIPDAHYLTEARYRGAQVVTIAPDYNQSAIHGDLWLSVNPGTDAALALAACRVVIEENLYRPDYVREQTDLPFLVREDTGRLLREADIAPDGGADRFAWWDEASQAVVLAPGSAGSSKKTLEIPRGVRPALEASAEVQLISGERVRVRTVFSALRQRLDRFELAEASRITGIAPGLIRRFARSFATARAALILSSYGGCKFYHSDLIQRSQILLASLTGNIGRPGGGWRSTGYIGLEGTGLLGMQDRLGVVDLLWLGVRAKLDPAGVRERFHSMYMSGTLFHAIHGRLLETQGVAAYGDPALPRSPAAYVDEAVARGHYPVAPPPGAEPPEVIFNVMGNLLRSCRMGHRLVDTLFAKARIVVDVTYRMGETSRQADILLPCAGWYEKPSLKYMVNLLPYVTLGDRAVPPLGESKTEWELFSRLADRVASEARRRGISSVKGFRGNAVRIDTLGKRFTDHGRFGPGAEEDVLRYILRVSQASRDIALEDLRRQGGAVRVSRLGPEEPTQGTYCDYRKDAPIVPMLDFVEKKRPYPTLSGRQQFYVDHPWFLELGEELPTHKAPPRAGGDHPFTLTAGHARWSIHSNQRDDALMLRLQRGEPVVYMNTDDARRRGIADHDLVYVWNDVGSFVARAKITAAIHPRQLHMFHAWEPFQFRGGRSHQSLHPSPIKVTQLVGDYGHLHWRLSYYDPNQNDRDTRVDVRKA